MRCSRAARVAEAAAFGVADVRLGQAIVVVARGDGGREHDLRERLRRELPSFMQPARYEWRRNCRAMPMASSTGRRAEGGAGVSGHEGRDPGLRSPVWPDPA
jgi:acyl-CoA synthetase (AMP-forming)/AMP-acid ligase II